MKEYKYYIGCENYMGDEHQNPSDIFNDEIVPYLESCGLSEDQIKEVYKMTSKLAETAYDNGIVSEVVSSNP